jgi:hypothetical protein
MTVSQAYKAHVNALTSQALAGSEFAVKSLACLSLLAEGWRYGDPDPSSDDETSRT